MKLRILQWNVLFKEDPNKIAAEIQRIDPDIICGQELIQHLSKTPQTDTAKQIASKIGYYYAYQAADSWSNRDEKETQGNAIFSRYPILNISFQHLQPAKHNPPDPEHEGRVYIEARIVVDDNELSIGTTHLSYSHMFTITDHRKKEIDNLLKILQKKNERYVFTGDLNSIPGSYTVNEILKINALKNAGPNFSENTWTTKPFDYGGFKEEKLNWRLDYAFLSKDIDLVEAKIVKTDVSDHLPILLEIEI